MLHKETPLEIPLIALHELPRFVSCGKKVWLLYDAISHPKISGNKYWKLYGLYEFILRNGYRGVISFGGAYSNHLHALGTWSQHHQVPAIAVVRGEKPQIIHHTLSHLFACGVKVVYVSREQYRKLKNCQEFQSQYPDYYILPEGGSSPILFEGMRFFIDSVKKIFNEKNVALPKNWFLPGGTGGSAAGLVALLHADYTVHVINVLKHQGLKKMILDIINTAQLKPQSNFIVYDQYHLGGYAKFNQEYIQYIQQFYRDTQIMLDPVYTGKMLMALEQILANSESESIPDPILIWHTGGLQGNLGFNERYNTHLPVP